MSTSPRAAAVLLAAAAAATVGIALAPAASADAKASVNPALREPAPANPLAGFARLIRELDPFDHRGCGTGGAGRGGYGGGYGNGYGNGNGEKRAVG